MRRTEYLASLIKALDEHNVYNPDDENRLQDQEFRDVTDETTNELIDQIEEEVGRVIFPGGEIDRGAITQLQRKEGVKISEAGSPYEGEPSEGVQITLKHGTIGYFQEG